MDDTLAVSFQVSGKKRREIKKPRQQISVAGVKKSYFMIKYTTSPPRPNDAIIAIVIMIVHIFAYNLK